MHTTKRYSPEVRTRGAPAAAISIDINAIFCGLSAKINVSANADVIEIGSRSRVKPKQHRTKPVKNVKLGDTELLVVISLSKADALNRKLKKGHYISLRSF